MAPMVYSNYLNNMCMWWWVLKCLLTVIYTVLAHILIGQYSNSKSKTLNLLLYVLDTTDGSVGLCFDAADTRLRKWSNGGSL